MGNLFGQTQILLQNGTDLNSVSSKSSVGLWTLNTNISSKFSAVLLIH